MSAIMLGMSPPKAAQELAKINFGFVSCPRQISRIALVASRFTDIPKSKSFSAPELTMAAKWKILSVETEIAFSKSKRSVISPVRMVTRGSLDNSLKDLQHPVKLSAQLWKDFLPNL